jgi:hypothetical protein
MLCLLPDFGKRENVAAVHRLYDVHPIRHCEEPTGPREARPDDKLRDEAIQTLNTKAVWIASLRSQ